MKKFNIFSFLMLIPLLAFSQSNFQPVDQGGGEYVHDKHDQCLTEDERNLIKKDLQKQIEKLKAEGKLTFDDKAILSFSSPVAQVPELDWYSPFGISNFVDHDDSGDLLDYLCGQRTYDGHFGTDIATWPFSWYLYENDYIDIVAGADGTIIQKIDGNDDDHCDCFGSWNAVYVTHTDGSIVWYGHLKKNSLTDKKPGDTISKGEYLGKMASSGCSTGPHLHLEVYDNANDLIDPYVGSCNQTTADSWWEDQDNYWLPQVNTLLTHYAVPEFGCPTEFENPHMSNEYQPGDLIYFITYFRDEQFGGVSNWSLIDPNGDEWRSWVHNSPSTYPFSWWWWSWNLPFDGPYGEWTFQVDYLDESYTHNFSYGSATAVLNLAQLGISFTPNPVNDNLSVHGLDSSIDQIKLYGIDGTLYSYQAKPTLNLSSLSAGLYIVMVESESEIYVDKIVKL